MVTTHYSFEEIYKAYKLSAEIVSEFGEVYLPIFERLHKEVEDRKANQSRLDLAKSIAAG